MYLTRSLSIKYLVVLMDNVLSWEGQINSLVSRVRKLINIFKILRASLDFLMIRIVYFALGQFISIIINVKLFLQKFKELKELC